MIELIGQLRRGQGSLKRGENGKLVMTYTVDFRVRTDDQFATRDEILLNTPGAPLIGVAYGPLQAVCVSKTCTRNPDCIYEWELSCEFDSTREEQQFDPQQPDNPDPTTWIPIWRLEHSTEEGETMYKDALGVDLLNRAGEIFEDLPRKTNTLVSWTFNQFEDASLSHKVISDRHMHVNAGAFYGFAAKSLLLSIEDCELGHYNGFRSWNIKYKLTYKQNTWETKTYSFGYNYLNGAGELVPWITSKGVHIFGPHTATGGQAPEGSMGDEQTFLFYPTLSFTFIRT